MVPMIKRPDGSLVPADPKAGPPPGMVAMIRQPDGSLVPADPAAVAAAQQNAQQVTGTGT